METIQTLTLFIISYFAGLLGSMSGLGGGLVIVPVLLHGFGIPLPYAVAASLLGVIATSIASTSLLLPRGLVHLPLSVFLETASVLGAIFGASIAYLVPAKTIALIFSAVLFYTGYQGFRGPPAPKVFVENGRAPFLDLSFTYKEKLHQAHHPVITWFSMLIGGILSSLLGIGSGVINVILFERLMGLPLLVATATSSSMIGMTAAASAWVYLEKGFIDSSVIYPLVPGILLGSLSGAYLVKIVPQRYVRYLFSTLVLVMGIRMLWGTFS